jgi:malate dehydrogenase
MAVASDGSYGIAEGIISSFPVRLGGGSYEIEQGLEVGEFAQSKIDATVKELTDERAAVVALGLV